jgi:hypothetical protein
MTMQRGTADKPGGVIANLLLAGQPADTGGIQLRSKDRNDLAIEHLFVRLYTRSAPLGAGQAVIQFSNLTRSD